MTEDRRLLVLGVHSPEQFVYITAQDEPMSAHHDDHVGLSVSTKADFDEVVRRAEAWSSGCPTRSPSTVPSWRSTPGCSGCTAPTSPTGCPSTVEVQWFEWLPGFEELGG